MSAVAERLSFAEFQLKFRNQDRHYEYWDGEAIPKAMPTWIHGLLQALLGELLRKAGYKAASEVELRIEPDYHPIPDIIATRGRAELPYPTKAVEIVIEILSPEDSMSHVLDKCARYRGWGISSIYVLDIKARIVYQWMDNGLKATQHLAEIPSSNIWAALDRELC